MPYPVMPPIRKHTHKLATDGCTCFNTLKLFVFFHFYNIALGLQLSCDLLTNGCGSPDTSAHPTLLPCYTVGKLHPKPYTAKIQSAVTICGGYLGHDVPGEKKKRTVTGR